MSKITHSVYEDKYTISFDEDTGKLEALRYGEPWRDLTGDGMVLAMLQEIDNLKNMLDNIQSIADDNHF